MSKALTVLDNCSFLLACLCAFLGMANVFSLQGYFLLLSTVLLLASLILHGLPKMGIPFWLLAIFGISYNAFCYLNGVWGVRDVVYFIFCPPVFYLLGSSSSENCDRRSILFLCAFASGMFLSAFSIILNTFLMQGIGLGRGQQLFPHFGSDEIMSRTGLSLYLMPACGVAVSTLFSFSPKKRQTFWDFIPMISSFFICLFSLFCSSQVGNRAFIVAFALLAIVGCITLIFRLKSNTAKTILLLLVGFVMLFSVLLVLGWVPSFLANIPVFDRFLKGGSNESRLNMYKQFLLNGWRKPFGGTFVYLDDYYLHNFWLDIYTFAGIVPFAIFSYLLVMAFTRYGRFKISNLSTVPGIRLIFFVNVAFMAIGLFEPLFQANPFAFGPFALFFGACASLKKKTVKIDILRI